MTKRAILVLEDGSVYEGFSFGAEADAFGEVVFNTSMVGYQEMLTDPSYAGQIVVPTYPLIGNYGINEQDFESNKIQVSGFVVREECLEPSHYLSVKTLHQYLAESAIPGISGVDTRAITRRLRSSGVMMGMLTTSKTPQQALEKIKNLPDYGSIDYVKQVTTAYPLPVGADWLRPNPPCSRPGLRLEIQHPALLEPDGLCRNRRPLHHPRRGNP